MSRKTEKCTECVPFRSLTNEINSPSSNCNHFHGDRYPKLYINNYIYLQTVCGGDIIEVGKYNVIADDFQHGKNCKIGHHTCIEKEIVVGDDVTIGNYCDLYHGIKAGNSVIFQGHIRIAPNCRIGNKVTFKYGTILTTGVLVKDKAFFGPNSIVLGGLADRKTKYGTVIGENVYIGACTKIAAGTKICEDVIIGANSFVNKDITSSGVYVGNPVKKIRDKL